MRTWATNEQCAIVKMGSVYNKEHKTYLIYHQTEIKNCSRENWIFEIYLKIGSFEDLFENWSLEN